MIGEEVRHGGMWKGRKDENEREREEEKRGEKRKIRKKGRQRRGEEM